MFRTHRHSLEIVSLFLCGLLLFTWGLQSQEVISFDSRFYLFAQEMWDNGVSWFATTYHKPYPDYPASSTFLIYIFAHVYGGLNKFTAVLPSAIAAAVTLTLTYRIGALHDKRWGLGAVFFMLLTMTFLKSARSIALDMYLTLFTTCCFYLIHSADIEHKPRRVAWVFLVLFLGFALRGPIGLVMPTGVVCTYYVLNGRIKRSFLLGLLAFGLLIICSCFLLALAYHVGGNSFMNNVLRMQVLGRMDSSFLPYYFYFMDSMSDYAVSFPLACLVFLGWCYHAIMPRARLPEMKFLLQLLGWMGVIMLGMSIPGDKKIRYVLPMVPAAALLAAYTLVAKQGLYFIYLRRFLLAVLTIFPLIFFILTVVVYVYAQKHGMDFSIHYALLAVFLTVMQIANGIIFYYTKHDLLIVLLATVSFVVAYLSVMERIELSLDKARDFVVSVEAERIKQHAQLIFYKEKPDSLPIKYLINMPIRDKQPLFVDYPSQLLGTNQPAFFVTSAAYFAELPKETLAKFKIIASDKLAHVPVVVFASKDNT